MKLIELTALRMAVKSNSDAVREKAARDLGVDDEPKVIELLLQLINDKSPLVRRAAAESLGLTKNEKAFDPLVKALKDQNPGVKRDSATALAKLHMEKAAPVLATLLADKDPDLRQAAEEGLASLGDWAVEPVALSISPSSPDYAKISAIKVLADSSSRAAVFPLVDLLLRQSEHLPYIAKALSALNWKPTNPEEFVRYYLAINRPDIILKVGDKALSALILQLKCENKDILISAITAIGQLKNNKAIDSLMELLSSSDNDVRAAVIRAVGTIADPDTVVPIIFALNDEASEVVVAACEALSTLKDSSAVSALVKVAEGNEYVTKSAALKALGNFDDQRSIGVMISALREKRHEVRKAAIDSLIGFGPKTNMYFAECVTDVEPHVRRTGIMALRQANAADYCDVILDAVRDKEYSVRRDALETLAAFKCVSAVPEITRAIGDENTEVQVAAISAIGVLGSEDNLELLIDCSEVDLLHDEAVRAIYNILMSHIKQAKTSDLEKIANIKVTTVMTKKNSLAGDVSINEINPAMINDFARAELQKRK